MWWTGKLRSSGNTLDTTRTMHLWSQAYIFSNNSHYERHERKKIVFKWDSKRKHFSSSFILLCAHVSHPKRKFLLFWVAISCGISIYSPYFRQFQLVIQKLFGWVTIEVDWESAYSERHLYCDWFHTTKLFTKIHFLRWEMKRKLVSWPYLLSRTTAATDKHLH